MRIIDDFKKLRLNRKDRVIEHCLVQTDLRRVIEIAALAIDKQGKKHNHQSRVKQSVLIELKDKLIQNIDAIQKASSFREIHGIIESLNIKGCGSLTSYDTAHRIGVYLNLLPVQIYLHSGTKIGAEKLLDKIEGNTIGKDELPEPLKSSDLSCADIEDLLCIYKDRI